MDVFDLSTELGGGLIDPLGPDPGDVGLLLVILEGDLGESELDRSRVALRHQVEVQHRLFGIPLLRLFSASRGDLCSAFSNLATVSWRWRRTKSWAQEHPGAMSARKIRSFPDQVTAYRW